jgi:hemerythrin
MALMQWSADLSVGIAGIDKQHQQLIQLLNELNTAMLAGKGREVYSKTVSGLIQYTQTHFKAEERYFDEFGYPEAATHKREHAEFVKKVAGFKAELDAGRASLSVDMLRFLSGWLQTHIKGTDKKYTDFLNARGIR